MAVTVAAIAEKEAVVASHNDDIADVIKAIAVKLGLPISHTERREETLAKVLAHYALSVATPVA